MTSPQLLTDPFLQLPTANSVRVVWFTEFAGSRHTVHYGTDLKQTVAAKTIQLSRTREDQDSQAPIAYSTVTDRLIWRHEAEVTGLVSDVRVPYRVTSVREDGATVSSETFTLAPSPSMGRPLKILLTSDHQLKPLVAANYQKVVETVGAVDLVLFAGDLVNIPDRASEWFDDTNGNAFFPTLQGKAHYELEKNSVKTRYTGGALIQSAPLYATIGNHEVMGRFSTSNSLNAQFGDAVPRWAVTLQSGEPYLPFQPEQREAWLRDRSFNTLTYEEILTLPESSSGGKRYYAVTFGDLRLVVLYITNVWRPPGLGDGDRGKYRERTSDFNAPENWGYGQHIFEPVAQGSEQYRWLEQELRSPEFRAAKYKVVMFHHPPHTLGENSIPAYTDPRQQIDRDATGKITAIRYEYPLAQDYIVRDVLPLLEAANVQLVFFGHSHLWNRFVSPTGMHFLETSNVGNSYGAYLGDKKRHVPEGYQETYAAVDDPNGLAPVMPTIAPLKNGNGQPLPYIACNDTTVFSIFDTGNGSISSYRFDTCQANAAVVKFDEFRLRS
jgi:3',5'-cyclic AMP phosphodiesterase CpdA